MKTQRVIINILTALPFIAAAAAVCFAPDKVPMHYNIAGEVDRWGSRWELLTYPLMPLLVRFVMSGLSRLVAKDRNAGKYAALMANSTIAVIALFDALAVYSICTSAIPGIEMDIDAVNDRIWQISMFFTGLSLIPAGYGMRDIPYNKNIGVKTTWSLANEESWRLSQRFGCYSFIAAGAAISILSLVIPGYRCALAALAVIAIMSVVLITYTYAAYRKSTRDGNSGK